jgi:hypothetical protein
MSRPRTRNAPQPTWTSLVEEALRTADDFLGAPELVARTGGNTNQISAALHGLLRYRAVDCVSDAAGRLFWFATPQTDTRTKRCDVRRPEDPGTRRRGPKRRPPGEAPPRP